jgi:hypothetical protein
MVHFTSHSFLTLSLGLLHGPPAKEATHTMGPSSSPQGGVTDAMASDRTLERLQEMLVESIHHLGYPKPSYSSPIIHDCAQLIFDSMSVPGRVYHSVTHVFDVARDMTYNEYAIPVLAALFHDVVYLSIDKHFIPAVQEIYLSDVELQEEFSDCGGGVRAIDVSWKASPLVNTKDGWCQQLVDYVFGGLVKSNTNEYLSALVAVRALQNTLSPKHLLQLAACIEATIPFRAVTPDGTTPMEALYQRLHRTNDELLAVGDDRCNADDNDKKMTEQELIETVQHAAWTANCDLGSFSASSVYRFLENSWQLLPEWTPALLLDRPRLQDLRDAFLLLTQRYQSIHVDRLFPSFRGFPATIEDQKERSTNNLRIVGDYAYVRLFGVETVLEALTVGLGPEVVEEALSSIGGSSVFCRLFDERCRANPVIARRIPMGRMGRPMGWKRQVHDMLVRGRPTAYLWDAAEAPWAAYLYNELGLTKDLIVAMTTHDKKSVSWVSFLPDSSLNELTNVLQGVFPEHSGLIERLRKGGSTCSSWGCAVS